MSVALIALIVIVFFFFSSRRRHTRSKRDWSSDVCSSDLEIFGAGDDDLTVIGGSGTTAGLAALAVTFAGGADTVHLGAGEIGRASCRERVWVGAGGEVIKMTMKL